MLIVSLLTAISLEVAAGDPARRYVMIGGDQSHAVLLDTHSYAPEGAFISYSQVDLLASPEDTWRDEPVRAQRNYWIVDCRSRSVQITGFDKLYGTGAVASQNQNLRPRPPMGRVQSGTVGQTAVTAVCGDGSELDGNAGYPDIPAALEAYYLALGG